MNKKIVTLLTGAVAALALTSCRMSDVKEYDFAGLGYVDHDYIAPRHVLVNMAAGDKQVIDLTVFPGSYGKNISYTSSDESVAKVSAKGEVTALKQGISDISVTSSDDLFSSKVRVVVSKKSTQSGCATALNNIASVYASPDYVAPKKVVRYEYSHENYYCEDVLDHGMSGYEAMGYNADTGYFFVEGPSVYVKTPYGHPEVKDGKWIFYPINYGLATRLIHITPTVKNYFDINTANYNTYDEIIKDIMNFFFVSGEKILNDLLEDYEGLSLFNDLGTDSDTKFYAVDNNSVFFDYSAKDDGYVIDADDEINYMDIPAGTVYDVEMIEQVLNRGGRTLGMDIDYKMFYKRDGKNWQRYFVKSQLFDTDFEEFKVQDPSHNGYTEVDSMYDL